jgi:hypothetical protein
MPWVGFEPTFTTFEPVNRVRASERAATVTGSYQDTYGANSSYWRDRKTVRTCSSNWYNYRVMFARKESKIKLRNEWEVDQHGAIRIWDAVFTVVPATCTRGKSLAVMAGRSMKNMLLGLVEIYKSAEETQEDGHRLRWRAENIAK